MRCDEKGRGDVDESEGNEVRDKIRDLEESLLPNA